MIPFWLEIAQWGLIGLAIWQLHENEKYIRHLELIHQPTTVIPDNQEVVK